MISNYLCGSEEEFVKKMNEKASSLGMKDTTFVNSSGLDEKGGNYSSSYDMALLTSYEVIFICNIYFHSILHFFMDKIVNREDKADYSNNQTDVFASK